MPPRHQNHRGAQHVATELLQHPDDGAEAGPARPLSLSWIAASSTASRSCGARRWSSSAAARQGLNQGLNMRDSGLDISYALRADAIGEKRVSFRNATENGFKVGTYEELIPSADLGRQPHSRQAARRSWCRGHAAHEEGRVLWPTRTASTSSRGSRCARTSRSMVAPKGPGSEVRVEYTRGFGIPTLIAVHRENDPERKGWRSPRPWPLAPAAIARACWRVLRGRSEERLDG